MRFMMLTLIFSAYSERTIILKEPVMRKDLGLLDQKNFGHIINNSLIWRN